MISISRVVGFSFVHINFQYHYGDSKPFQFEILLTQGLVAFCSYIMQSQSTPTLLHKMGLFCTPLYIIHYWGKFPQMKHLAQTDIIDLHLDGENEYFDRFMYLPKEENSFGLDLYRYSLFRL